MGVFSDLEHLLSGGSLSNNDDSPSSSSEPPDLGTAYSNSRLLAAGANLYALEMYRFISRMVLEYRDAALSLVGSGVAQEEWSDKKIKLNTELLKIIEKALETQIDPTEIRDQLVSDINVFLDERLPAAREEYQQESGAQNPPSSGRLESKYIYAILKGIDIIYRIFVLYQIADKTKEDCRSEDLEAVKDLEFALLQAQSRITELLRKIDRRSLENANRMVTTIEGKFKQALQYSAAARAGTEDNEDGKLSIDRTQLLSVHGEFARSLRQAREEELRAANRNPVTLAKKGVRMAGSALVSGASIAANIAGRASEAFMARVVPTQGPSAPPTPQDADLSPAAGHEPKPADIVVDAEDQGGLTQAQSAALGRAVHEDVDDDYERESSVGNPYLTSAPVVRSPVSASSSLLGSLFGAAKTAYTGKTPQRP